MYVSLAVVYLFFGEGGRVPFRVKSSSSPNTEESSSFDVAVVPYIDMCV